MASDGQLRTPEADQSRRTEYHADVAQHNTICGKAARKPMLLSEFERGLLPLRLNTPAFAPLFQLPPQLNACNRHIPYDERSLSLTDLIQPPIILPISTAFPLHISYLWVDRNLSE